MGSEWINGFPALGLVPIIIGLVVFVLVFSVWPLLNQDLAHVPGPRIFPFFYIIQLFFSKEFYTQDMENIKMYGKVFRVYEGRKPSLVVADTEMLKQILIKKFDNFTDRAMMPINEILDMILFRTNGARWRRLRYLMTPPFTTGRIKRMWGSIKTCVERLDTNVGRYTGNQEGFNVLGLCYAYSMDALCTSVLAVDAETMSNTNHPLLTYSIQITRDLQPANAMIILSSIAPVAVKLLSMFGIETVNSKDSRFVEEYLDQVVAARKRSSVKHDDFLQMLIDAPTLTLDEEGKDDLKGLTSLSEAERLKGLTSKELLAQVVNLVLAGYDTTGRAMAYFLYCMAKNQDVQENLYQEIKDAMDSYEQMTFERISNMTCLDQCIQESLRLHPVVHRVDRVARRDVQIMGVFIPRDTVVQVPLHALQHDPDIWPEPFKFDPERFSAEAKSNRDPFYNHIPFGKGPRHCIGQRLALLEMKMAFVHLFLSYRFSLPETAFSDGSGAPDLYKHGLWIKVDHR